MCSSCKKKSNGKTREENDSPWRIEHWSHGTLLYAHARCLAIVCLCLLSIHCNLQQTPDIHDAPSRHPRCKKFRWKTGCGWNFVWRARKRSFQHDNKGSPKLPAFDPTASPVTNSPLMNALSCTRLAFLTRRLSALACREELDMYRRVVRLACLRSEASDCMSFRRLRFRLLTQTQTYLRHH